MAIIYTIEDYGIQSSTFWCLDQARQHEVAAQLQQANLLSELKLGMFDTENLPDMKDGARFKQWSYGNIVYDGSAKDSIDNALHAVRNDMVAHPENYLFYDSSFVNFARDKSLPDMLENTKHSRHTQTIMPVELPQTITAQEILDGLGIFVDEPELGVTAAQGNAVLGKADSHPENTYLTLEDPSKYHMATTRVLTYEDAIAGVMHSDAETISVPVTEKSETFTENTEAKTEADFVESVSGTPDSATAPDEGVQVFRLDDDEPGDDASFMFEQTRQAESPQAHITESDIPPVSGTKKIRRDLSATEKPHKEILDADQPESALPQSVHPRQAAQQPQQGQQQMMMPVSPPGLVTRLVQALLGGIGSVSMPGNHTEPEIRRALEPSVEERLLWSRQKQAIDHMLALEDRLESCKEQYNAIRHNPAFNSALEQVQDGSLDPKDFFLTLARSSRTGKQEYQNLDTAIQAFSSSISEMGTLVRQVERSCTRADIDSSNALGSVGTFLNDLKDDPASSLMPNEAADATLADSVKEMIASLMKLFRKADAEEEEDGPSLAF